MVVPYMASTVRLLRLGSRTHVWSSSASARCATSWQLAGCSWCYMMLSIMAMLLLRRAKAYMRAARPISIAPDVLKDEDRSAVTANLHVAPFEVALNHDAACSCKRSWYAAIRLRAASPERGSTRVRVSRRLTSRRTAGRGERCAH